MHDLFNFAVYFAVILHSGTFCYPGMDLPGTRDNTFDSGTIPGIPEQVVTLMLTSGTCYSTVLKQL
jgi:hypothetical protein